MHSLKLFSDVVALALVLVAIVLELNGRGGNPDLWVLIAIALKVGLITSVGGYLGGSP